jgi:hypothetical protein
VVADTAILLKSILVARLAPFLLPVVKRVPVALELRNLLVPSGLTQQRAGQQ